MSNLEIFERAFSDDICGPRGQCACGQEFFDYINDYDWEEGEFEKLINDPDARGADHSIGYVRFEGRVYVNACECWHERAKTIIGFLNSHTGQIADYLNEKASRLMAEAKAMRVNGSENE